MKITNIQIDPKTKQIKAIYTDAPSFMTREEAYHHLLSFPGSIQSGIFPHPNVIPIKNKNSTVYIRTKPTKQTYDNLKP